MTFTSPKAADKPVVKPAVAPVVPVNNSPMVAAAHDAATNINHACGEITSATSEHVIKHKAVDDLVAKIRGETASLLSAVEAAGGPKVA